MTGVIKGKLTNSESGGQKGELSWITTGVQIQEELSIIDLNRRVINRKEQSVIGPDRKRCTLYLLQDISKKKKGISNSANEKPSPPWTLTFLQGPLVPNKSPQLLSLPLAKNVPLLLCVQSAYASAVVYLSCFVIPPHFWINPLCLGENPKMFILKVKASIILLEWAALEKCVFPWKVIKECSYRTVSEYPQLETTQMFSSR